MSWTMNRTNAKGDLEVKIWSPLPRLCSGPSTSTEHFTGFSHHLSRFLRYQFHRAMIFHMEKALP
jgi:hypothetical protein